MDFKPPPTKTTHWSNLELTGLLEDEDSCVELERVKKHLGLYPFHLTDLSAALREILNAGLNAYDPELKGLVLAYRNPRVISPLGDVLYDTCFIHIDIEADFYIFRPEVGRSLKGFVNKKGTNHVGILVHKTFNVSLPKPKANGRREDEDEGEERYEEEVGDEWPGNNVRIGQEVRFRPDEIDYKSKLPYIRGSLYEENYLHGCKLFNEDFADLFESEFQEITRRSFSEDGPYPRKPMPKTENKRIVFNSDSEPEANPEPEPDKKPDKKVKLESDVSTEEPLINHSKKRKRKSMSTSESETELTQKSTNDQKLEITSMAEQTADSSTNGTDSPVRKPKKKKRKESIVENDLPSNADDEKKFKSSIDKSLTEQGLEDDAIETEADSTRTKKRKRKRSLVENDAPSNTEDEKDSKLPLKNLSEQLEVEFQVPGSPPKKRKKKRDVVEENCDTEDERKLKKSLVKCLTHNTDDIVMDTEDERNYKSSLKTIVHSMQINTGEDDTVPEECKKKKKKKHKKKEKSESEPEFDPSLVKVKLEPESEAEDARIKRKKLKKLKNSSSESRGESEVVKVKKMKSSQESEELANSDSGKVENGESVVKTEEEQEARRKSKKNRPNKESCE